MDRLIQLDGGLWPGFSGAPIVNMSGQIIGIATSALARGRAIVIPTAVLRRSGEQLLTHGRVAQPYLGVGTQSVELPARLRARLELQSSHGLLVMSVASPGPAETAGIMLGDVLIALDTLPTRDIESLTTALGRKQIGAVVPLTLLRGGEIVTVDVTLGARPHAR
jgi:serine protease Do